MNIPKGMPNPRQLAQRRAARGFTVFEVAAAATILILAGMLFTQLLFLSVRQERAAQARHVALRVAAIELETLAAREWKELVPTGPTTQPAPPEVRQLLPTAELRTEIQSHENDSVREVCVEIVWRSKSGAAAEPIRLAFWKHRPAEDGR
jgi:hypothetical protein